MPADSAWKKMSKLTIALLFFGVALVPVSAELPVKDPGKGPDGLTSIPGSQVRNPVSFQDITNIGAPYSKNGIAGHAGFTLNMPEEYSGKIYVGSYPFEKAPEGEDNYGGGADYDYMRFRRTASLENGKGRIPVYKLFRDKYNSNSWKPGNDVKTAAYRIDLYQNGTHLGFYQSRVSFVATAQDGYSGDDVHKHLKLEKRVTIVQGPYLGLKRSDDPSRVAIMWETDADCRGKAFVAPRGGSFGVAGTSEKGTRHQVEVDGLSPDSRYRYYVQCGQSKSQVYTFRTAPKARSGDEDHSVTLAFCSDSREGTGGGERAYMGHNLLMLRRIAIDAYRRGAEAFLFGGDLVNGYTSSTEGFELQLKGWKQALAGFWRSRPVYPAMGNHETLLNIYDIPQKPWYGGLALDKWTAAEDYEGDVPVNQYTKESAEAVFAQEFVNPLNGPEASDERRPTYKENVYKFQYGPVLCIAFNNNYWWTTNVSVKDYGGSPEGYIMEDQMQWIEKTLDSAEKNPTVKYVLLYAQEPIFPCGGHTGDAMWWDGNNHFRAYAVNSDTGKLEPRGEGMIEVRNRFWKAVSNCSKVAAVLAGDEHEYHRLRITKKTPVGTMKDDTNGDGVIDWSGEEPASGNPDFTHPTWQLTAGTGGAPYYSLQDTPWKEDVNVLASQPGYILFRANERGMSATFYSFTGQKVDHVENLMEVK